jgi:mono/diheme cytochrome c family protein
MFKSAFSAIAPVLVWCCLLLAVPAFAQDGDGDGDGAAQPDGTTQPAPAGGLSTDQAVIDAGGKLFAANCKQCHAVKEQVVGPALAGINERRDQKWLINFIKYPQKVIDGGDAYAQALYKKYQQYMPNHDFLKDEEIVSILSWVKAEETKVAVTDTGGGGGTTTVDGKTGEGGNSGVLTAVVVALAGLLVIVLAVLALLGSVLAKYLQKDDAKLSEEDTEVLNQRIKWGQVFQSGAFIGIVSFVFLALVLKVSTESLLSVGVQQGYAPTQPIPFSHKLHAGQYEIDCKYCHTGVEKGKSANIPSANICMNCHNAIKTVSPQIAKIYAAIEKDEPIQWVRVHNLPDLAYFNHQQHVKVAGLECENCHGNIKEMEVVQQASLLTMGWCIDCHRKTDVNAKGNAYYDNLVELHKKSSKEPLKVEDIGGLECSKCHY